MEGVRPLAGEVLSYDAPSTEEIARRTGLDPADILRFDGNTSPQLLPSTRAEALLEELSRIHTYPHGGYPRLVEEIARYAGVEPENVVLGAGAAPFCPFEEDNGKSAEKITFCGKITSPSQKSVMVRTV